MADPRHAGRRFLVDRFHAADCGCPDLDAHTPDVPAYYRELADAILNHPGVGVTVLAHPLSDTTRAAILLPAEEPPA